MSTCQGKQYGPCSVLMIDPHPVVHEGVARIIEPSGDFVVCCCGLDLAGAHQLVHRCAPHVVVTELDAAPATGFGAIHEMRTCHRRLPILVFSRHTDPMLVHLAFAAGANGYAIKSDPAHSLLDALRRVVAGGEYLSKPLTGTCDSGTASGGDTRSVAHKLLTKRELQILDLIGRGYRPRQIADCMFLSVKTVESHRDRIKAKLDVSSAAELARYAITWVHGHQPS